MASPCLKTYLYNILHLKMLKSWARVCVLKPLLQPRVPATSHATPCCDKEARVTAFTVPPKRSMGCSNPAAQKPSPTRQRLGPSRPRLGANRHGWAPTAAEDPLEAKRARLGSFNLLAS